MGNLEIDVNQVIDALCQQIGDLSKRNAILQAKVQVLQRQQSEGDRDD